MRVALYTRQSKTRGDESASVADQLDELRERAVRDGWDVVGEYADTNAPAARWDKRERWTDLLADAEGGRIDAVAAVETQRLWRPDDVERVATMQALRAVGIERVITAGSDVPMDSGDNPEAAFVGGLLAQVAQYDNALRAKKVRRSMAAEARNGQPHLGGHRPFGWRDRERTVVDDHEAALIREAFMRITGPERVTVGRLATDWNERGLRTSLGNRWTRGGLTRVLAAPSMAGLRELPDGGLVKGWDGILTPAERDDLVAVLGDRRYRARKPEARLLSASRLLHCGICGHPMSGSRRARSQGGERVYRCAKRPENDACGRLTVMAELAEAEVRDRVLSALDGGLVERHVSAALLADKRAKAARDTLGSVTSRRAMILRLAAKSGDEDAAQAALDDLAAEERDAREVLEGHVNGISLMEEAAKGPAAWWADATDDARRELLDACVLRITVKPGDGGRIFRPERIAIDWRV